jgi:hypothetical protein
MTLKLTLDKVHQMVEKAIEEKGTDYIYPNWGGSCSYVDYEHGSPAEPGQRPPLG